MIPLNELFPLSSLAIITARDKLTIAWSEEELGIVSIASYQLNPNKPERNLTSRMTLRNGQ